MRFRGSGAGQKPCVCDDAAVVSVCSGRGPMVGARAARVLRSMATRWTARANSEDEAGYLMPRPELTRADWRADREARASCCGSAAEGGGEARAVGEREMPLDYPGRSSGSASACTSLRGW